MDVKKNLMLWLAVFALALPLVIAGTASAMYMDDGARPDGTGGWKLPTDFVCVLGVHADGTMDIVSGVTDRHTCQYYTTGLTAMNPVDVTSQSVCGTTAAGPFNLACNTSANCKFTSAASAATWNSTDSKCYDSSPCTLIGATNNDGARHALATSICVDGSGNGISLKDMDRTAQMCVAKGGTWKQTSATAPPGFAGTFPTAGFGGVCVAYGAQFKGQNAAGSPSAFGAKGTAAGTDGQGYCYTSMDMTSAVATFPSGTCPSFSTNASNAYDWAYSSSKCTYAKSIAGYLTADLISFNGTRTAAGTFANLSTITTMGECLAAGASWNNWVGVAGSTRSIGTTPLASTIPTWDYTTQAPDADAGCLHCHSTTVQYNGPAERFKDSYLKTGHKNMLRKVTAGIQWAGPDGVVYTKDTAGHAIDFTAGTVGGGPLYYLFGDWMAAVPDAVGPSGDTTSYTCGACHTSGFNDATNKGTQAMGTPGYVAAQPSGSYANNVAANNKWDLEGIQCARCHNAAVPAVTAAMISANTATFTTTAPLSGGMGALASGTGRTNLCFGCHQSIAKNYSSPSDLNGTTVNTPTQIPVGVSHGAAYGRDFNGHVIGNSFLNSPHSRYTGTIKLNSLGKYDLGQPNGTTQYSSIFKGYTCWQGTGGTSSSPASPAKTKADGTEIKTKSECETLYGAGSWRADASGDNGTKQGSCSTCHDVHNSMFVASQEEAAMRKTCADCHVNNVTTGATDASLTQITTIAHPVTHGAVNAKTPFDYSEGPCVVCHMATQAVENGDQNSLAAHLWRINVDPNYNTFPTMAQFYGGSCSVHTGAVQNAPSSPVVYLSDTTSAACTAAAGTWTASATKTRSAQTAADGSYTNAVWVDLTMACGQCHGASGTAHLMSNNVWALPSYASKLHTNGTATFSTVCLDCHGAGTHSNIIAGFGPGKNHHGAVPGESAECIECHTRPGTLPDGWETSAFCLPCHQNYPTPNALVPHVSHHSGACVTCHIPGDTVGAGGVTGPGVIPVVSNCNKCHAMTMAGTNHMSGAGTPSNCQKCHNHGGFTLNPATDHSCDQCHGGGLTSSAPTGTTGPGIWISSANLAIAAQNIHSAIPSPQAYFTWLASTTTSSLVNFDASTTVCPSGYTCTEAWAFGDSATATGLTTSHVYSGASTTYTVTLTVTSSNGAGNSKVASINKMVTLAFVNHAPVAAGLMTGTTYANPAIVTNATNAVSFTDASTDVDGNINLVTVNWGDGIVDTQTSVGGTFTHHYARPSKYTIIHTVRDSGGKATAEKAYVKIVAPTYVISGSIKTAAGTPVSGVVVALKLNGHSKAGTNSNSGAATNYTFPAQLAGNYTLTLYKSGCTFTNAGTISLTTADVVVPTITATCH